MFSSIAYADTSESLYSINDNIVVGLLKTEEEIYPHEIDLSQNIYEMFNNWGIKTVLIDCNKVISLKKIQAELLNFTKQDEILARKLALNKIKVEVIKFIKEHKINRILILGNYYNSHSEPFLPTPYYWLITEAIIKVVDNNPTIHLLYICSGLQGIMNIKGIKVVSASNLISNKEKQRSHLKLVPNLQQEDIPFQQIKIVPNSRLAKVIAKFLPPDENGWFSTYFPNIHSGVVSNTLENRKKLELLGYKVVAFSSDGVIEAIEDKHGNIYFQSHLEALVIRSNKNLHLLLNHKAYQVSALVAIAIINDFLYRT